MVGVWWVCVIIKLVVNFVGINDVGVIVCCWGDSVFWCGVKK